MVLRDWLDELEYELVQGSLDAEVEEVIYDSRRAAPGCVFVCIAGTRVDSHKFIPQVLEAGVRVIVAERDIEEELSAAGLSEEERSKAVVLRVKDGRRALALLSAARFGYPARRLILIGVTGTKGKTTTAHMIRAILEASGRKTGLIGTTGIVIGDETIPTQNTTPESYTLHQAFAQMADAGCAYAVMEVSSQSMKMHRVDGLYFDIGLFTNISPDHIGPDEHENFEEYLYYKSSLLSRCRTGLVNRGDEHFHDIIKNASCQLFTYQMPGAEAEQGGKADPAGEAAAEERPDFTAAQLHFVSEPGFVGTEFQVNGRRNFKVRLGIPGLFNVENALAAIGTASLLGIDTEAVCRSLEHMRVNGRMEIVHKSHRMTVLVDYAHNAVSMESLLKTLRLYRPKRLICVFGCGGNRSKDRRYSMGAIGGRMADLCILTADNSRYERVEDILEDIRGSVEKAGGNYILIPDRREAIAYSIRHAQEGDMIAVIGKGHEDYQEINGVRTHFLDREVIEETIEELRKEGMEC